MPTITNIDLPRSLVCDSNLELSTNRLLDYLLNQYDLCLMTARLVTGPAIS